MAKYQKYAEYKDSGVEWLGAIPGHWGVTQLKRLGKFITGMTPSTAVEAYYSDEITEYGWIRPEDILEESEKVEPTKFLTKLGWETQRTIPAQSTLICCIGTIGKLGFLGKRAVTNQQITALVPDVRGFSKYYYYLLTASRNQLEHLATGNVVKILNSERLGSLWLPLLSSQNEARQIVHFLDYETAKIDHLIEKQQQLIELLKERRQAVISHAVTKGLNPNVPMKDSGVEWLGEVPEHWSVKKLKYIVDLVGEKVESSNKQYVGMENISSKSGVFLQTEGILPEGISNTFNKGDILFGKLRPYLAKCWLADFSGICSSEFLVLRSKNKLSPIFLNLFLLTDQFIDQVNSSTYGSKMPRANWEFIGDLPIPVPDEQSSIDIANFLERQTQKYDSLIIKVSQQIALMQERRTALISAAVTGKIDVRHWQSPTVAETQTELSA